jgi:integration host factor subunit alpha
MTLTKDRIIDSIYHNTDLSRPRAKELFKSCLEIIKRTLESGEDVLISGFGKFEVMEKNERKGRNPATGDNLTLRARRVITFRCSGVLRERINGT